jgi:RimJ/RimL family protein N-acetyltransferase
VQLTTPRLTLREFLPTDFEAIWEYERLPETQRYEPPVQGPEVFQKYLEDAVTWSLEVPRKYYRLALTIPPDDTARGRISLKLMDAEIREWEVGWTVHPELWGRGYATEGARTMLAFAFDSLGAHRVVAFCHAQNAASTRVMEKLGMQRDAHLRETLWRGGAWYDELVYSILEREWQALETKR